VPTVHPLFELVGGRTVTDEDVASGGIEELSAFSRSINAFSVLLEYNEAFRNEFRKALQANDIEAQNVLLYPLGLKRVVDDSEPPPPQPIPRKLCTPPIFGISICIH
jgi:hypothetical protein